MQTKVCYKCKRELSIELFGNSTKSKDGHSGICKECKSKQDKEYREKNKDILREKGRQKRLANRDEINAKKRKHYQENKDEILLKQLEYRRTHKEQKAEIDKKYAQNNKEKIQQYQKNYREEHKLSNAEYQKQYREKNKERLKEYNKSPHTRYMHYKNSAKKRDHNFTLSEIDFIKITEQPCIYCGEYSDTYNGVPFNGVDRIDSNLGYSMNNCVPCCTTCNRMKLDLNVYNWMSKMKQIINYFDELSLYDVINSDVV